MKASATFRFFILLFVLFSLSNCGQNDDHIFYNNQFKDEIKAAHREALMFMATGHVPGASFAISKNGKLIYSEAMGLASTDLEVPATRNTKFRIADVSEVFTSLIYQLMVEDGTLHPDSSVRSYLPDFPEKNFDIKLENLVHHTSGIREPAGEEINWRGLNISLQKGIENFKDDPLVTPPGEDQFTSAFNYNLLGAIMEKATGKRFHEILKNYVTDTLHLENTVIDNPFISIKNRSDFYDYNYIAQVVYATFRDMRYRAPSQGLLSTSEDMVKLGNAILYSDYISDEIKNGLFKPVPLSDEKETMMANGWMLLKNRQGTDIYGRSGEVTGGSAVLLIIPKYNLVFACAINLNVNPDTIPVFRMVNHFLPESETKENNQESTSAEKEEK